MNDRLRRSTAPLFIGLGIGLACFSFHQAAWADAHGPGGGDDKGNANGDTHGPGGGDDVHNPHDNGGNPGGNSNGGNTTGGHSNGGYTGGGNSNGGYTSGGSTGGNHGGQVPEPGWFTMMAAGGAPILLGLGRKRWSRSKSN